MKGRGNLRETLAVLMELQRINDNLKETREASLALKVIEEEQAETLLFFDGLLSEKMEHIQESQSFCDKKRREIQEAEEDLRRSRSRLGRVSSQRELTALNKELDSSRRKIKQRGEELQKLLSQLEESSADYRKKSEERDQLKREMDLLLKEKREDLKRRKTSAESQNSSQAQARGSLAPSLRARFERISQARAGVAVSDASEGRCKACNLALSPQIFIRIQRMESLEICSSCNRYLIFYKGFEEPEPV